MPVFLSRVQIQNFQSIRHLDLPFALTPTVLVGESNVGKSAVIRAIRTILSIPRGNSFITDGATSCILTLHLIHDDGPYVLSYEKRRGGGTKLGLVTPARSFDWQAVTALPDEVRALDLSGLVLDEDTVVQVNIASQLDDLFLLRSNQAVTAAKALARISAVDRIHKGLKAVATDTVRLKTEQTTVNRSLADAETKHGKYSKVAGLVTQLDKVQLLRTQADTLGSTLERMSAPRLNEAVKVWTTIERIDVAASLLALQTAADAYKTVATKVASMKTKALRLQAVQQAKARLSAIPSFTPAATIRETLAKMKALSAARVKMENLVVEVSDRAALIEQAEKDLAAAKLEMETKFPVCPTCKRPWDHAHA